MRPARLVSVRMPSIAQLEKLLAVEPNDPFVPYALGQEHAKQGQFAVAVTWYDKCLALDPTYCYAYYHKARALEHMNDPAAVRATLKAGLKVARTAKDEKAASEITTFLDSLR